MTDRPQTPVEIVRGELQPWTDYSGGRHPAGGAPLVALLDDLLPASVPRTLIAGPHGLDVIELAAARSAAVTVLVRSVSDAADLRAAIPASHVTVVAGALDGLSPAPFDVVLAADGLDRVHGADSPALDWPARAADLRRLATPGALLVAGVENEFALTGLFDRRPPDVRHGDDEWRPLHDDPARPTSPEQVRAALGAARVYAVFDEAGLVHTLLDAGAAAAARPGRPGFRLAAAGLAASAAPVADGAAAAARAGLLGAVAPGWLAVSGPAEGRATRTCYTVSGGGVLTADLDGAGWALSVRSARGVRPAGVTFDPALVPDRLNDTESVEATLIRLAAAEDVPGFRALAARVGAWADAAGLICLDDLHPAGDGFTRGVSGWRSPAGDGTAELMAAAWHRLRDRLLSGHHRHPWPPWMAEGDDLAAAWLAMSGVEATTAVVKRGREIADLLAEPVTAEPDVRAVLAGAEADRARAADLAGRVFGLERTLRFRDQSLRTREQQLRATRDDLRATRDELRRLRRTAAVRLQEAGRKARRKVAKIRHPRQLARAVRRRLRRR